MLLAAPEVVSRLDFVITQPAHALSYSAIATGKDDIRTL